MIKPSKILGGNPRWKSAQTWYTDYGNYITVTL